jgi:hypothetical protein
MLALDQIWMDGQAAGWRDEWIEGGWKNGSKN